MLWVLTKKEAKVFIEYFDIAIPDATYKTISVFTKKERAYTAHLLADNVEPGNTFNYTLYINDKKVLLDYQPMFQTLSLWQW